MNKIKSKILNYKASEGFTLLEVIVALAIIGIGFVLIMELFSGALRSGKLSSDYSEAIIYAKGKMEEILNDPKEGSDKGEFNNSYKWQSDITLFESDAKDERLGADSGLKVNPAWKTYKIKIKVLFHGNKKVELVTIKSVTEEKQK